MDCIDRNEIVKVLCVRDLFMKEITIPHYQRQYSWTKKNVRNLLSDIDLAVKEKDQHDDFKYRIGTIILFKNSDSIYEIVDGQQRIVTLLLLNYYLTDCCEQSNKIFENERWLKISKPALQRNYRIIKEWFSGRNENEDKEKYKKKIENLIEAVVITVDDISEAFQMFDSQNSRGKSLEPHDLLKAYHLRTMSDSPYEMRHAVTQWESESSDNIRSLFNKMFRIWNWSRRESSEESFSDKYLEIYYGIEESSDYTYAKRIRQAMPYFQINESFVEGRDFFSMVEHYMHMLDDIYEEFYFHCEWLKKKGIKINIKKGTVELPGDKSDIIETIELKRPVDLFTCAMLLYYDKFHRFDQEAVTKLLVWSMMIRVDIGKLGYDSINAYAIGTNVQYYSNSVAMFYLINSARKHTEISNIVLNQIISEEKRKQKLTEPQKAAIRFLDCLMK